MTDTPVLPETFPAPSRLDQTKAFIGDLARPFTIITAALASFYAIVRLADAIAAAIKAGHGSFEGAAIFIGAVLAGVSAIYIGKAMENAAAGRSLASVEIAKEATKVANAPASAPVAAGDGATP